MSYPIMCIILNAVVIATTLRGLIVYLELKLLIIFRSGLLKL